MQHYIKDANEKAEAFLDSEDGVLFATVCIGDEQYDFALDEKEIEIIKLIIEQGKEKKV